MIYFKPKSSSTISPSRKNTESAKIIAQRDTQKIVDSLLGNNRTFGWKVSLLKWIIYDDRLKVHTEITDGKWEDNNSVVNSMEQTSTIFSI